MGLIRENVEDTQKTVKLIIRWAFLAQDDRIMGGLRIKKPYRI